MESRGDRDGGGDEVTDELKLNRRICLCISVCFKLTLSRREETRGVKIDEDAHQRLLWQTNFGSLRYTKAINHFYK